MTGEGSAFPPFPAGDGEAAQEWGAVHMAEAWSTEPTPRRKELRRLGDELRRIIEALMATAAEEAVVTEVADQLAGVADRLGAIQHASMLERVEDARAGVDRHAFFDDSPMIGRVNPVAPPMELRIDDTDAEHPVVRGTVRFGDRYEGPPGCCHGGFIAACFDELLGMAQGLGGRPGMTGRLTVHYRSPTPLHEELTLFAEVEKVEGRKIFTRGTLHHGDRLCAESEGLFISVDFSRFAERLAGPPGG